MAWYRRENWTEARNRWLEKQLEALDNCIDNAKTADEWQKLSTVRQRLFEQWRIMAGIPQPGSIRRRMERNPSRQPPVLLEPLEE